MISSLRAAGMALERNGFAVFDFVDGTESRAELALENGLSVVEDDDTDGIFHVVVQPGVTPLGELGWDLEETLLATGIGPAGAIEAVRSAAERAEEAQRGLVDVVFTRAHEEVLRVRQRDDVSSDVALTRDGDRMRFVYGAP